MIQRRTGRAAFDRGRRILFADTGGASSSSWPGIAVRRTASLPLASARPSTSCWLMMSKEVDTRHNGPVLGPAKPTPSAGHDQPGGQPTPSGSQNSLPRLHPARLAVAHQAVEVHPDV